MNNAKPPFDNVKVRQALNYAVDRSRIVRNLIAGRGLQARQLADAQL